MTIITKKNVLYSSILAVIGVLLLTEDIFFGKGRELYKRTFETTSKSETPNYDDEDEEYFKTYY